MNLVKQMVLPLATTFNLCLAHRSNDNASNSTEPLQSKLSQTTMLWLQQEAPALTYFSAWDSWIKKPSARRQAAETKTNVEADIPRPTRPILSV
jgi:hypothetical protein